MPQRVLLTVCVCILLVIWLRPLATNAQQPRCFTETGFCIEGVIRTYWEQNGGLPVFGYPTTELRVETNNDGWTGPTQWFERDRLEDHGSIGVLAGRLGSALLEIQNRPWQSFPQVDNAPDGCFYFELTRHSLCEPFKSYWERNGGLERFGYPITEPFFDQPDDWSGTVQYFERRRMEHHTELAGTQYEVLLGLLGNEVRALDTGTPAQPPALPPYPAPAPGTDTPTATATDTPVPDAPTATPTPTEAPAVQYIPGACLTAQDVELARLINAYRNQKGLPSVPISKSLTHVAQAHVLDLHLHRPDTGTDSRGMECNLHSWSDQGDWSPVCYTSDHRYAAGMWDKPREITGNIYTGNGYEISYQSSAGATPSGALNGWQGSPGHNNVIIEQNNWGPWQAMGIAVYEQYAVAWFGREADPQGTLEACP